MKSIILAVALASITALHLTAQSPAPSMSRAVARSVPEHPDARHVFVLDSAHLMTDAAGKALQDSALALQAETGADIAFVTLPSLHGGAIEEAALAIGRLWKVGSAGSSADPTRARGVVILYVPDKKSVAGANLRVEVGRGLEGAITDGGGSREIIEAIKPDFRAKRYGDGFLAGYLVAAELVRKENTVQPRAVVALSPPPLQDEDNPLVMVVMGLLALFLVMFLLTRKWGRGAGDAADDTQRPVMVLPTYPPTPDPSPWRSSSHVDDTSSGMFGGGSSSSSSSDNSGSSDGGSFGGGGDFSGGGASDTV